MGVIRAEPARVTDWAAKSVGAVWRAFDLQLTTYAALLAAIGLVMAYTNSVESGESAARHADHVRPRPDVGRARGRRVHRRDRVRLPLAQDARLADLRPPPRAAGPDPRDRQRRRRRRRAGSRSAPFTFQFSELAKILMIIVLAQLPRQRGTASSIRCARSSGACLLIVPAARPRHAPAGPRDVARLRRDPRRDAVDVRGEPQVAGRAGRRRSSRSSRSPGPTSCATTRSSGSSRSSTPTRTSRAPATSSTRRRSRSARAGGSARA